jgi:hypothetical protein
VVEGRIVRDGKGRLYLHSGHMPSTSGFAVFRRAPGETSLTPVVQLPLDSKGYVLYGTERLSGPSIHARGDGTLFVAFFETLFALPPGGTELVKVFDCGAVVGKYCTTGGPVFTNPRSDESFIAGYRLPKGTAFPVVPEALGALGPRTEYRLGADGTGWAYDTEEDALMVDYPPYLLDVTTVRRLKGTTWEPEVAIVTPSFTWVHSDHDAFYSFGRQLISGGIWTSWGVYSIEL